jgi:hypothetical protein
MEHVPFRWGKLLFLTVFYARHGSKNSFFPFTPFYLCALLSTTVQYLLPGKGGLPPGKATPAGERNGRQSF